MFRNLFHHIKILQIARLKNKQTTASLPFPSYDNDDYIPSVLPTISLRGGGSLPLGVLMIPKLLLLWCFPQHRCMKGPTIIMSPAFGLHNAQQQLETTFTYLQFFYFQL